MNKHSKSRLIFILSLLLTTTMPSVVQAHGDVAMIKQKCTLQIGPFSAFYANHQPQVNPEKQYCDDIPAAGKAFISVQFDQKELFSMPMDYRAIKDVKGTENDTKSTDLGPDEEIEAATVYYIEPKVYERGAMLVTRDFEKGHYIGIVTAKDPENNKLYKAVFPFSVGYGENFKLGGKQLVYAFLVGSVLLIPIILFLSSRRKNDEEENS